jgi:hypothetical protein
MANAVLLIVVTPNWQPQSSPTCQFKQHLTFFEKKISIFHNPITLFMYLPLLILLLGGKWE